jgi:ferredoxin-NADP reductase
MTETAPGRAQDRRGWRSVPLAGKRRASAGAVDLTFAPEGWPGHTAGQHVDVRLTAEDGYQTERSYSIASAPEDEELTLTIERLDDGEVSPYLVDDMQPGDELELRGPIGGWFTWQVADGGPLLLLGGGSGVVPLMSMLRHRARQGSDVPARLLLSARAERDVLYARELDELGAEVLKTFTREPPPGWTGWQRRVDREMLAEVAWPPAERPLTYICGPTGFVEAAATALVELGHDPALVKTERFGPTGGGTT